MDKPIRLAGFIQGETVEISAEYFTRLTAQNARMKMALEAIVKLQQISSVTSMQLAAVAVNALTPINREVEDHA